MGLAVLLVEDHAPTRLLWERTLQSAGYQALSAATGGRALHLIAHSKLDIGVLDVRLPDMSGLDIAERLRSRRPGTPIVIVTGFTDTSTLQRGLELRINAWLEKPLATSTLLDAMDAILAGRAWRNAWRRPEGIAPATDFGSLIGRHPSMLEVYRLVARLARSDTTVLIRGESGTGKELVARLLHDKSDRRLSRYCAVNVGSIPDGLIDRELFGHDSGAFTDARNAKEGWFEAAEGGTLFLDEIGDLSPRAQISLLRVLDDRRVTRVGSTRSRAVDVRVVAATNRNLDRLVAEGLFRADLHHRLLMATIDLPPIRGRGADLRRLIEYYLPSAIAAAGSGSLSPATAKLTPAAERTLLSYSWPGNVRELRHALLHGALRASTELIDVDHLPDSVRTPPPEQDRDLGGGPITIPAELTWPEASERLDRELIARAIAKTDGRIEAAARLLRMDPKTLRRKLRRQDRNG